MELICNLLEASLRAGVAKVTGLPAESLRLHMPARHAAAACPLHDTADAHIVEARLECDDFPKVLGTSPVTRAEAKNDWLHFTLTDDFYTAAVRKVQEALPLPANDLGNYTINHMLRMARAGGDDCPKDAAVQRAWLLTLCAHKSHAARQRAMLALNEMTWLVPPNTRTAFAATCGGVAGASARLLYELISKGG